MPVLRALLILIGIIGLTGAAITFLLQGPLSVILWAGIVGTIFLLGGAFERIWYKKVASQPPGPGFVLTSERFVDPETGRLVDVYERPETGERAYVDSGKGSEAGSTSR